LGERGRSSLEEELSPSAFDPFLQDEDNQVDEENRKTPRRMTAYAEEAANSGGMLDSTKGLLGMLDAMAE